MNTFDTRAVAAGLIAILLVALAAAAAGSEATQVWRFDALLDGKPIGAHEFVVERRGAETLLRTRADFRVNVLFIPVYRYRHENREVWRDGCLTRLEARTWENGDEQIVRAQRSGSALEVRGPAGDSELAGCVKSFAYWDPGILDEPRLLNSQTGEYETVRVVDLGRERIDVRGRSTDARRHSLQAGEFTIDLWYSAEGQWLGLESLTPDGRRLRYEIR